MRISLEAASTLAAAVDAGSLEAAAARLAVTPSAVSQRIKALEREVGQVLLVRSRPVQITPAGSAIVRLSRQRDLLEHDVLREMGIGDSGTPVVSLAVNADSLATWFLPPLAGVAAQHRVAFDLHRDDQDHTAELLETGRVMAAVSSRAAPVPGCRVAPLGVMRYEAVASPEYVREWGDRVDGPVVVFDRRDDLQDRWMRAHGVDAASVVRHHVPSSQDFASAVLLGLGWGMLPTLQSETALREGRLVRRGGDPIDIELHWQQWDLRSALLDTIAAEVSAAARVALTRH